jgi:hypothetical protein
VLDTPDLLLRVIQNRPKYGLTLTQRRLHRVLYYLTTSRPSLSSSPPDDGSAKPTPFDHFTTALSLLPIYQTASARSLQSPARTDPVVALCLLNLALTLPIFPEKSGELQAAVTDITSHLGKKATADTKGLKKVYSALERSQLSTLLKELKSNIEKLSQNGIQIQLPQVLSADMNGLPSTL